MLDLLEHYIYDSLPREDFATSPGLRRKVGPEGELLPFYGCTAVFWLPRRGACSRSRWSPGPST